MQDILTFRRMIVPVIIQVIFWIGVAFCVIVGLVALIGSDESWGRVWGVLVIIVGPFVVRVYCEFLIVIFRINETLSELTREIRGTLAPAVANASVLCSKCGVENPSSARFCKACGESLAKS